MLVYTPEFINPIGLANEPIVLVFKNDAERIAVANHLLNMPAKEGIRQYAVYDKANTTSEKMDEFMDAIDADPKNK